MTPSTFTSLIDHELNEGLIYSFEIVENVTEPDSKRIRLYDRFRFSVVVENRSAIPIRDLRGVISRTDVTEFEPTPFSVDRLEPAQKRALATIEGSIVREPSAAFVFDQIGVVSASAFADLSFVAYQEWDKPLVSGGKRRLARLPSQRDRRRGVPAEPDGHDDVRADVFWGPTIPLDRSRGR
jgi:hypothetical protein